MSNQSTSLEKLKSLVQKEQRLFVFLIFPQLTETGMIFLNTSEHLFHIRLGEMHQKQDVHGGSYRDCHTEKADKGAVWLSGHRYDGWP